MPVNTDAIVISDIVGDTLVARVAEGETCGTLVCLDAKCHMADGAATTTLIQFTREDAMALAEWIRAQFCEEVQA